MQHLAHKNSEVSIMEDAAPYAVATPLGAQPAFPDNPPNGQRRPGLTKREYFAAMAMQGLCAGIQYGPGVLISSDETAGDAVEFADKLLQELAKPHA